MNKKSKVDSKGRHLGENITYDRNRKRYRYSYKDASGEFKSIYSTSYEKLLTRIDNIDSMTKDGISCYEVERATVNTVFDRYISSKTNLRSTTMANYTYMYDKFIRSTFGKKKIAKIVFSDVLFFYKSLLKDMSINTVEVVNTVLRPTFQFALRDNLIKNNPVDGALSELKKVLISTLFPDRHYHRMSKKPFSLYLIFRSVKVGKIYLSYFLAQVAV